MKILYVTFVNFTNNNSGSSVRPLMIYRAFSKTNCKIKLLTGEQNDIFIRNKNILAYFNNIKSEEYTFCYVELPSGPVFNILDHILLLYINKIKKIPIGVFYRDAYWKFGEWYDVKGIKRKIINLMSKFDLFMFKKFCKIIYFPSNSMKNLFNYSQGRVLPPAAETNYELKKFKNYKNCIYVGGITERYGIEIILNAFKIVNEVLNINLILICRRKTNLIKQYEKYSWLKLIIGKKGNELKKYYNKSDIGIIPFKKDVYMDFAIPIKLFEYISNKIPVIATNCNEVENILKNNQIGLICKDNCNDLAKKIIYFYNMEVNKKNNLYENVEKFYLTNQWDNRINKIISDLS